MLPEPPPGTITMYRCKCGGHYTMGPDDETGEPTVTHTKPLCQRYIDVQTTDDAIKFSEENRRSWSILNRSN